MGHEGSPELSGAGQERKPASISCVVAAPRAQARPALTEAAEQDLDEAVRGTLLGSLAPVPQCPALSWEPQV